MMWIALPSVAVAAVGRASTSASAHVSVTIPRIAGLDISPTAHPLVSSRGTIEVKMFHTSDGAMLIRTAPPSRSGILEAGLRAQPGESRIIAAAGSGWQQFHDTPPSTAVRTSTGGSEQEITYELWQF